MAVIAKARTRSAEKRRSACSLRSTERRATILPTVYRGYSTRFSCFSFPFFRPTDDSLAARIYPRRKIHDRATRTRRVLYFLFFHEEILAIQNNPFCNKSNPNAYQRLRVSLEGNEFLDSTRNEYPQFSLHAQPGLGLNASSFVPLRRRKSRVTVDSLTWTSLNYQSLRVCRTKLPVAITRFDTCAVTTLLFAVSNPSLPSRIHARYCPARFHYMAGLSAQTGHCGTVTLARPL